MNRDAYVYGALDDCQHSGCQLAQIAGMLIQVRAALAEKEKIMAELTAYQGTLALWCSRGAHAFSELDPGRIIIPPASGRDEQGEEIIIPAQAICGEHAKGLGQRRTRPLELTHPHKYDPEYTAALERELGMQPSPVKDD